MAYELKPPFEIYLNGVEICDAEGHLCTAEGPAEAEAILAALNFFASSQRELTRLAVTGAERNTPR